MSYTPNTSMWKNLVKPLIKGKTPGQLIIQLTTSCNAACPQCEMRRSAEIPRSRLTTDQVKAMIDEAAQQGIQALSFTGGEPLLMKKELIELIRHAGAAGIPYIRTGTNGFMFRNTESAGWEARVRGLLEELASTNLYTFWISIDSAETKRHEDIRGLKGVIKGIEKAVPLFHEYSIYPAANLGINRYTGGSEFEMPYRSPQTFNSDVFYHTCRNAFNTFYRKVVDLGFTITNTCYPMSVQTTRPEELELVYQASSSDIMVRFRAEEKVAMFRALIDTIPSFRDQIRIFTPRCSLYSLSEHYDNGTEMGYPCRGGKDYFFVDSTSTNAYPCGFRAESLGPFTDMDRTKIEKEASCRKCDWECFRDPSEMLGPILELRTKPMSLLKRLFREKEFIKFWREDLRYYNACSFFSGRKAPDYQKMKRTTRRNHNTSQCVGHRDPHEQPDMELSYS